MDELVKELLENGIIIQGFDGEHTWIQMIARTTDEVKNTIKTAINKHLSEEAVAEEENGCPSKESCELDTWLFYFFKSGDHTCLPDSKGFYGLLLNTACDDLLWLNTTTRKTAEMRLIGEDNPLKDTGQFVFAVNPDSAVSLVSEDAVKNKLLLGTPEDYAVAHFNRHAIVTAMITPNDSLILDNLEEIRKMIGSLEWNEDGTVNLAAIPSELVYGGEKVKMHAEGKMYENEYGDFEVDDPLEGNVRFGEYLVVVVPEEELKDKRRCYNMYMYVAESLLAAAKLGKRLNAIRYAED